MIGIKNTRAVVLLGSLLLTLVVTGGLFAYAYTVASRTIAVTAASGDFAEVTANNTAGLAYDLLGSVNGKIDEGVLFDVAGDGNYSGDVEVLVSLANADELVQEYRFWMMRLVFSDAAGTTLKDKEAITKVISLSKPETSFIVDNDNITGYVYCEGGSWKAFPYLQFGSSETDPLIFVEVIQASTYPGP